mmetsp:Transcript_77129/g.221657  ORF Transcript_77129/g.221657 Transcript_77129/m.221657 type:complete len:553 (+) Transcript_77129:346-2004(+)
MQLTITSTDTTASRRLHNHHRHYTITTIPSPLYHHYHPNTSSHYLQSVALLTYVTIRMLVAVKRAQLSHLSMLAVSSSYRHRREPGSYADAEYEAAESRLQHSLNYATIATHAFHTDKAGRLVMSATTFSSLGACGGYLAFVVGLLAPILRRTSTEHTDSTNPFFMGLDWLAHLDDAHLLAFLLPVIIPLTWVRSFGSLAFFSMMGNVIFVTAVTAVLVDGWMRFGLPTAADFTGYDDDDVGGDHPSLELWPGTAGHYAVFLAPCIYLFTVHYCVLPIESECLHLVRAQRNQRSGGGPDGRFVGGVSGMFGEVCEQMSRMFEGFDGALAAAILASGLMNAVVGALCYVFFMQAPAPPHDPVNHKVLQGCSRTICDNIVKNVSEGPVQIFISAALIGNLAITFVLMLAPSREYMEAAVLGSLARAYPSTFAPRRVDGEGGQENEAEEDDAFSGKWLPGRDNWARCWVRNIIRICLVLITSSLAVAVPHFALLSGLVGGVSDTLQSLVLPPLLYVVDVVNKGKLPGIASPSTPKVRGGVVTRTTNVTLTTNVGK